MFYFAWTEEAEIFDPEVHLRQDLDIFDLKVCELETTFPTAQVAVQATADLWADLRRNSWGIISYNDGNTTYPLFKGCLSVFPMMVKQGTVTLEFVAKPADCHLQLDRLRQGLLDQGEYDPLFYPHLPSLKEAGLADLLENHCQLVDWSRVGLRAQMVPYMGENNPLDFHGCHFAHSLDIAVKRTPIMEMAVNLHINWAQQFDGETCLDPVLQGMLASSSITSLTGDDLVQRWWAPGEKIPYSGYKIKSSSLKYLNPGKGTDVPKSQPIRLSPHDPVVRQHPGVKPQSIRLKKHHLRPSMTVRWHYRQPRSEHLAFIVCQELDPAFKELALRKHLNFNLPQPFHDEQMIDWLPDHLFRRGEYCAEGGQMYVCCRTHRSPVNFQASIHNWLPMGVGRHNTVDRSVGIFLPQVGDNKPSSMPSSVHQQFCKPLRGVWR